MAFELENGRGSAFKNDRKENDKHPDYKGRIKTPSGEELDIAIWGTKSKDGKPYFSIRVTEKYATSDAPTETVGATFSTEAQESALPF